MLRVFGARFAGAFILSHAFVLCVVKYVGSAETDAGTLAPESRQVLPFDPDMRV